MSNKHAVALGKLSRGHTSPEKAAAARVNGQRGGRPRKRPTPTHVRVVVIDALGQRWTYWAESVQAAVTRARYDGINAMGGWEEPGVTVSEKGEQ